MSGWRSSRPTVEAASGPAPTAASDSLVAQLYAVAVTQQRSGLTEAAIATYRRCLAVRPDSPEIHNNLGTALDQVGRLTEAVACFRSAVALDPSYVRPRVNLGKVLRLQGKAVEATDCLERALALSPHNPAALTNLGFALADLGRRTEAIRTLSRAVELEPGLAEAHHGLGRVLLDSGDMAAAAESLQRAVALKPALRDACLLLASALLVLRRLADARAVVARVLEIEPAHPDALAAELNCNLKMCDWRGLEGSLARIRALECGTARTQPFLLLAVSDDPDEQLQAARRRAETATVGVVALTRSSPRVHERIRVAYVSGDFHTHATSFLIAELIELHDRAAFEILGVSYGPDDETPLRRRVLGAFDECLHAGGASDAEVAAWLAERRIDIAVDLKGYTALARPGILAHRPASIQVSYLGYPGSTGAPFIDYLVADPFLIPAAERRFYSESIAYLPDSYQVNDRRRSIAQHAPTRAEAGLPEEGFVFCCFNVSWKITAPVFEAWTRLLTKVRGSVLWLLEDNQWARENLRREAAARGIGPERLVFCARVNNEIHLARHRLADLFLDTFPCNAHTTASDALWTAVPVVTCAGRTFASRVAGSLLRAAGLPELITTSLEEYEALALALAHDPQRLALIRNRLSHGRNAHALFDTPTFCRHLEAAYRRMWSRQREGKAPETFAVERLTRSAPR